MQTDQSMLNSAPLDPVGSESGMAQTDTQPEPNAEPVRSVRPNGQPPKGQKTLEDAGYELGTPTSECMEQFTADENFTRCCRVLVLQEAILMGYSGDPENLEQIREFFRDQVGDFCYKNDGLITRRDYSPLVTFVCIPVLDIRCPYCGKDHDSFDRHLVLLYGLGFSFERLEDETDATLVCAPYTSIAHTVDTITPSGTEPCSSQSDAAELQSVFLNRVLPFILESKTCNRPCCTTKVPWKHPFPGLWLFMHIVIYHTSLYSTDLTNDQIASLIV